MMNGTRPRDLGGVFVDPLPTPRIIRGGEQVFRRRGSFKSYEEQLEDDRDAACRQAEVLSGKVELLQSQLDAALGEVKRIKELAARLSSVQGADARDAAAARALRFGHAEAQRIAYRRKRDAIDAADPVELQPGVVFHPDTWRISSSTGTASLSPSEGLFLRALVASQGKTTPLSEISAAVWEPTLSPLSHDHSINILVSRLRQKLRRVGVGNLITTISGIGYRLEVSA